MNLKDQANQRKEEVPEEFFQSQFDQILNKTVAISNWELPGTRKVEACFTVPEGYWLQMEDGIRAKLKANSKPAFEISRQWKLASVFASFLIIGVSIVVFLKINPDKTENWNAKIEKASDAEIMAAIDLEKSENQELALQMVALSLKKNDILFQPEKLKKEDIEKSIDDLTENEIYNELDIN